jgi:hypothetical protein
MLNFIGNLTHIYPYVYTSISCGGMKQTMVRVRVRGRVRV